MPEALPENPKPPRTPITELLRSLKIGPDAAKPRKAKDVVKKAPAKPIKSPKASKDMIRDADPF